MRPVHLSAPWLASLLLACSDPGTRQISLPVTAHTQAQLWIQVLAATPTYDDDGNALGTAAPGDRYRVLQQQSGWVQAVQENDPTNTPVWIELNDQVRAFID